MGLIEEVGTYLDAQSTRFSLGSSAAGGLYLNDLPELPATASALIETGGSEPRRTFRGNGWENQRVQLYCRSTSSAIARANIDAAWTILEGVTNQALSGSTYLRVSAVQSPFLLDRDVAGRIVFAANFDIARRR